MTKKRNSKNKEHGVKGKLNFHGGGNKFSAFEFNADDDNVGQIAHKYADKFAPKSPKKRSIDKYDFLDAFARGNTSRQNSSGNETSSSDVSERRVSPGSMLKSLAIGTPRVIKCSSPRKIRKARRCELEMKRENVCNIDSDEEGIVEMQTSTSYSLAKDRGSLQEVSSIDCEAVVLVSPVYVKVGNVCYTNCSLMFSSSYIKLVGCLYGKTEPHCLEWSTVDIVKIEHQPSESDKTEVVNLLLRSGDADVSDTCKTSSGSLELEFVVIDETQWCKKQDEIRSLNTKYESAWETIISECSFSEHFDDVVYPEGDPDGIFISRGDVDRLKPMTFLNDTIIDFYIKYLLNQTKPEEKLRFHFFNTFFFRKLADMDKVSSGTWDARQAFQRVRKWTRNIDLFDKDYIFIPVNFSLHWSLIVICHLGELVNIRDNDVADSSMRPCILHMDSIRGSHKGLENRIRSYLLEEWQERHGKQDADIRAKFSSLNFDALQLPQQENFFDCGLFLLHYAELFLAQAANFSTGKYSDVLNKEWFLPAEVSSKKRQHIRKLISKLASDNAGKERQGSCADKNISMNEGDKSVEVVNIRDAKETSEGMKLTSDSLPGDIGSILEADEDDKSTQTHFTPIMVGRIEVPLNVSGISSGVPQRNVSVNNGVHPVYEVVSTPEKTKCNLMHRSEPSNDIAQCVIVEDSEEEGWGAESIRITRSRRNTLPGLC